MPAIVSVPVRGGPVVEATVNPTVAEPFPLALDVTEIHVASDAAVHVQSGLDATGGDVRADTTQPRDNGPDTVRADVPIAPH